MPSVPARPRDQPVRDQPVSELPETENRTARADAGDGESSDSLWVSQDPGAAEPGRLERQSLLGVSPVSRRGPGPAAARQTSPSSRDPTSGTDSVHGPESDLGTRLCGRSVGRWTAFSCFDRRGHSNARELGDRGWAESEGRERGRSAEPDHGAKLPGSQETENSP